MPIRVRLTLLFALGTAIVLAVAGVLFYLLLRVNLRDSVDADLRTRSDLLTVRLADRFDAARPGGAGGVGRADAADLLVGGGSIAQVLRADGTPIVSSPDAGSRPLLTADQLARARAQPTLVTREVRAGTGIRPTGDVRVLAVAVHTGRATMIAVVGTPTHLTDRAEDRVRNVMVVATAPTIALAGLAAWLLSGAALRPVERMRRQAAAMAAAEVVAAGPVAAGGGDPVTAGRNGELAVPATHDEIAALARTMNDLLRRLNAARARDRAFVADAGHELRTPLTVLKAELELAARPGRTREELIEAIVNVSDETDRLIRLAESLLTLARMDGGLVGQGRVALDEVLTRSARAATGFLQARGLRLRLGVADAQRPLEVLGDGDMLRRAVDNLLANAARHAPAGSVVELRGCRAPRRVVGPWVGVDGPGEVVIVQIRDRGPGFPPEFLPHVFERFRRADTARTRDHGGAGLGLAIVAAIISAHGGTVEAANCPDGGAVVTVTLPATAWPPGPPSASLASRSAAGEGAPGRPGEPRRPDGPARQPSARDLRSRRRG
ncbi:cell wall metabolism sensor histidine kinase WalK [Frankia sp. CeD]|uniref:sensor histidine kinase n=1 Tax=Frankia sp. CeD TaxID=258230 RepID=UPI0004DCFEF5|nr:ATP-binding protein [Frankia sp. CeD]KEZ35935.1 signal transduction histidine kinase [Frankia sp. CeD]